MSGTVSHWALCPVKGCAAVVHPTDSNWPRCDAHPMTISVNMRSTSSLSQLLEWAHPTNAQPDEQLREWARLYGVAVGPNESDESLRSRILAHVQPTKPDADPLDLSDLAARGLRPMLREADGEWSAIAGGMYGPWIGCGPTQAEAIANLREQIPDDIP